MCCISWSHWLSGTLKPVTSELIDFCRSFFLTVAFHCIFPLFIGPFTWLSPTKTEVLSEHAEMAKAAAEVRFGAPNFPKNPHSGHLWGIQYGISSSHLRFWVVAFLKFLECSPRKYLGKILILPIWGAYFSNGLVVKNHHLSVSLQPLEFRRQIQGDPRWRITPYTPESTTNEGMPKWQADRKTYRAPFKNGVFFAVRYM